MSFCPFSKSSLSPLNLYLYLHSNIPIWKGKEMKKERLVVVFYSLISPAYSQLILDLTDMATQRIPRLRRKFVRAFFAGSKPSCSAPASEQSSLGARYTRA